MQFLNPALLFGATLFAVPLIIHLLNRQRFKRRSWAAMEFLLRAYKKQRRRLRRENLLLLLLRCAIPILLALAIARPQLIGSDGVGAMSGAAHHVIVLDHTYSMGLELSGATTPWERTKTIAANLVDRIAERENQRVTLVLSGTRPTMPLPEEVNLQRAKDRIAQLPPPTDSGTPLTEALLEVADLVEEAADPDIRVYVFTDLQTRAFGEQAPAAADPAVEPTPTPPEPAVPTAAMFEDTAADAVRRIRDKAELTLFDMHGRDGRGGREDNLQVTELRLGSPQAIARVPLQIVAKVLNRTTQSQALLATLEIDGTQPLRKPIELDAGAEGEVQFETTFLDVGQRRLQVSIEGDGLEADNRRSAIIVVREKLRVLLVEGTSETDPSLRETTHLVEVLDPTSGDGPPDLTTFQPKVIDTIAFLSGHENLADYDLVVLANVSHLDEQTTAALLGAVKSGTGLFVLFGDETDPESFNIRFDAGGAGPLPMRLREPQGYDPAGDDYYGIRITAPEHPVFADIDRDPYRQIFESLPVYRYFGSEPLPEPDPAAEPVPAADRATPDTPRFQVLASVRDPELSPLLVATSHGLGKVLFAMSPINRRPDQWNELHSPVAGISFLLLHPLAYWLTLPTSDPRNIEVGGVLTATVPERPSNLAVVMPERSGQSKVPVGEEPRPLIADRFALPPFRRTDYAGTYEFEMLFEQSGAPRRHSEFFAVNPPIEEGELAYYSHESARDTFGFERILTDLPTSSSASLRSGFSDLGLPLLTLLLLVLCGEAALARWVARRRS